MNAYDRRSVRENSVCVDNDETALVVREQRDKPPKKRKISLGLHRGHISVSSTERESTQIIVPEASFLLVELSVDRKSQSFFCV